MGRVTGTIAPDPDGTGPLRFAATRTTYDAEGRPTKVESGQLSNWQPETAAPNPADAPANWAGFTVYQSVLTGYDANGRKASQRVVDSNGITASLTHYSYDAFGRLECTAVRMNPAVYASLPASACTLGAKGTQGPDRITKNVYDAAGRLIQVRKAVGTTDENADVTYSYTINGKQQFVIDANGNRAQFTYDAFDRQDKWIFPVKAGPTGYNSASQATALATAGSVSAVDFEQYNYDLNDNQTKLTKRDGSTLEYTYDALNRVTFKKVTRNPASGGMPLPPPSANHNVYYDYDFFGRQLYARFDSITGQGVTNAYDGFGRLTVSTLAMDGNWVIRHGYDANGNITSTSYPDNATPPDDKKVTYDYDGLDRPKLIQRSGIATVASYSYDPAARRITFNGGVNTGYGYDTAGRLSSLTNNPVANAAYNNAWTFAYNPASQITTLTRSNDAFAFNGVFNVNRAYTANGLNQYTGAGGATFAYDANGSLTTTQSSEGIATFTYDVENRLVSASGGKTATLRYDPLGRLYEVKGATSTTRFVWDGDALLAEYDGGNNLLRRYIHGADLKADDPIAWYEGSAFTAANERILRSDWQGSIALVTDTAGSSAIAVNTYDEWGIPGANNQGRFQYTGQAYISELGLYHYKARFYSPTLGRFLQTDPIGYKDQINLYAYVGNDPANEEDFSGECPSCAVGAIVEIGFQIYTGELKQAVSDARHGNFGPLLVSGAKIGISAVTGGVGGKVANTAVKLVGEAYKTANIGRAASAVVRVQTLGAAHAVVGATSKVATNAVSGQPLGKGVPTAAAISGVMGVAASPVANLIGKSGNGFTATAAKTANQILTGAVKKEANCSIGQHHVC